MKTDLGRAPTARSSGREVAPRAATAAGEELRSLFDCAVALADYSCFLTEGRTRERAVQLVVVAETLLAETMQALGSTAVGAEPVDAPTDLAAEAFQQEGHWWTRADGAQVHGPYRTAEEASAGLTADCSCGLCRSFAV
jgi:hypothetical protein